MMRRTINAPIPRQPRVRGKRRPLVEGEDFTAACPAWCTPLEDGAWPTSGGWYLAVALFHPPDELEAEPVWVSHSPNHPATPDGWLCNIVSDDTVFQRREFYWIGKMDLKPFALPTPPPTGRG